MIMHYVLSSTIISIKRVIVGDDISKVKVSME